MIEPEKSIGLVIPAKAGIQQQKTLREADKHSVLSLQGATQSTGFPLSRE
jgi:hypothetical protein